MDESSPVPGLKATPPGLVTNGLGFAIGVASLYLREDLPPHWIPPLLVAITFLGAWRRPVLWPLAFAAAGLLWAQVHACRVLCDPFPEHWMGSDLEVTGAVASIPGDSGQARRFLFRVDETRAGERDIGFGGLVRLSWYRDAPELKAGERWRLTVRLKPPHGFANPGGFDYERWLFMQGIRATGHVRGSGDAVLLGPGPGRYLIDRWRQGLRDHIDAVLGDSRGAALVRALVLGDRSGLGPEEWEVLTRTGTNHLIAISGLHVGLVAAFLFFLARWAWSRSVRLTLLIAAPRSAAVAALAGAAAYSALAGFAVSTQRAMVMLMVVFAAVLFSRTIRSATGIVLALVGVLAVDPGSVLSAGFWLSFGAVAALLYGLGQRLRTDGLWSKWGRAQWVVALGLLPMLLLLFGRTSLVAPAVNLIAVPLFSLLLLPAVLVACLVAMVPSLELPLILTAGVLERFFGLLEGISTLSWSATWISERPTWVWAAAFVGAVLLLAPRGLPGRWLGLVLLLPLPFMRPPVPGPGEAQFTLLDVGQGLSAVVRTHRHVLVYDTGPRFPSGFNTGDAVVLPFLRREGAARIDTLILSHGDRDHAGGFSGLDGKIPINRILSGEPGEVPGGAAAPCLTGEGWSWDGVAFELLYPDDVFREGNESSCVLRVSTDGASVLLTGDVDAGVEGGLVARHPDRLPSTLLVAAHHGSDTSSGAAFLDAVAPRFVLYSTGFANRFGFPSSAVRARVSARGTEQLNTAGAGAISFRLRAHGIEGPFLHRQRERRLWTHSGNGG